MTVGAPVTGEEAVVRLSGVGRVFSRRDGSVMTALEGIDLDIRRGEFVSLI